VQHRPEIRRLAQRRDGAPEQPRLLPGRPQRPDRRIDLAPAMSTATATGTSRQRARSDGARSADIRCSVTGMVDPFAA
jgi:hypothetical protein